MVVDFPKLFAFDDTTTLGYLRLEKIKEVRTLIDKLKEDKETLQSERHPCDSAASLRFPSCAHD